MALNDREWLRQWQLRMLPKLRTTQFIPSKYSGQVTVIIYAFLNDENDFVGMEFSILQTWSIIGLLPVAIVCDRRYKAANRLESSYKGFVTQQLESTLTPGKITTMSCDMILNLHKRFSTPYCLIIQDDGFPINDTLYKFLGKWDYVGAPSVRDTPLQHLSNWLRLTAIGGGLSLRSHKICKAAAHQWKFWRHFLKYDSPKAVEDVFYTVTACLNPLYRWRMKFPTASDARQFDEFDFHGRVDIRKSKTFGVHGPSAIRMRFAESFTPLSLRATPD